MEGTPQQAPQGLNAELAATREAGFAQMPPEVREAMARAAAELAGSGIAERAVQVGDPAPDFALPDTRGNRVRLAALRERGPVVVAFYRGGWCPFCSIEMAHLARARAAIEAAGASLVAISPQTPDASRDSEAKFHPGFPLLSDTGGRVAAGYGLKYDLTPELIAVYRGFGLDIPKSNGEDAWSLPVPATYVIGTDGLVRAAHVDTDYTRRMEPSAVLAALEAAKA